MDHLDHVLSQWARERPDLDCSPMGVIGRLSRAALAVEASLAENFARHGIDAATFDVLATLVRQGPPYRLTPAELAADAMITSSAVAQRLNRLDSLGLIVRSPDPRDGRGKIVQITERGKEILDRVLPAHLQVEQDLLARLDTGQRDTLAVLLAEVTAAAEHARH